MTWEVAPSLQPRLWFSNFLNLGNSEDRQQNPQHMPQTKSVFFNNFLWTLTGQYISGRRKDSVLSLWPCVRRLTFRVQPVCELHWQCPLKPWKRPPPSSPLLLQAHRWPGYSAFIPKGRQAKPWPFSLSSLLPQEERKRKDEKKKRNEPPLNPPLQAASEPLHIWVLLISKSIPSICGPLSSPPQIPEVALTGPEWRHRAWPHHFEWFIDVYWEWIDQRQQHDGRSISHQIKGGKGPETLLPSNMPPTDIIAK